MRDTERPSEPVTAGIPFGAGPGPEVLSMNRGVAGDPLTAAVGILNGLGANVDRETANVRSALNASLSNQTVP